MKRFNRKLRFSTSALLPVLLIGLHSPLTIADEDEPDIYACKQCIKYTGWFGDLDFGLGFVSDDSLHFGDYRGLEEQGFYLALDGDIHFRNLQGRYFDLYARDLGYDSRQLKIRGGNQGFYQLRFAWKEIPKYRGFGTQTPYLGVGSDNLTLPADWVDSSTTDGMSALANSLSAAMLKTQRKTLDAGVTLNFGRSWTYKVDYQRQEKKGTRSLGAGFLFNNATILPAPVDFTTDQFDMNLTWNGQRAQLQLGFFSSYFDNGNNSVTWQNPFTSSTLHENFRAALEPDNEFYQFSLSGAFAITSRIRLSGRAAMGHQSQDEAFLPYTINPAFSDLPLPRSSLDGKMDTSTYNLSGKLSAQLNGRLSFTARGKWDERDNKTPVDVYTPVITDLFPVLDRYNRPYSYEREQYSADLRFRAHRSVRLSGGARQKNIDRTLQATERTEETTWWGEVKVNPWASSQLRVKFESSNRDVDDYLQPDDGGPVDHPLMRKFNQADRERERVLVDFDLTPAGAFGINLSYFLADSQYTSSKIGLQESVEESYSINLNYAPNNGVNLYAFLSLDHIDADLINTSDPFNAPWNAVTRDRIVTAGFGMSTRISEKSSIGFDLVSSDSRGDISVQTTALEEPFDPLRTKLSNAKVHFDHEINDRWGYKLYAEYEKFSAQDWAIDGLGVDGISSVLTMGEQSPEDTVWYLRIQASYKF